MRTVRPEVRLKRRLERAHARAEERRLRLLHIEGRLREIRQLAEICGGYYGARIAALCDEALSRRGP